MTLLFSQAIQLFFTDYLPEQRNTSPCTLRAYRDCIRLFLSYASQATGKPPERMGFPDISASLVLEFLAHLEKERHNSIRTRNLRLAAIRTLMRYMVRNCPENMHTAQGILAIPFKRCDHPLMTFLTKEEMTAILSAPSADTWSGRRDRVMLRTLYNTGARVSEIAGLRVSAIDAVGKPVINLLGKGRKERAVPIWKETASQIRAWVAENKLQSSDALFQNREGGAISRSGVEKRLKIAVASASRAVPSIAKKRVSPHTFRHSLAMHMLQSGIDLSVIALWLGHEKLESTHRYLEADMKMKESALKTTNGCKGRLERYRPGDTLMRFLQGL